MTSISKKPKNKLSWYLENFYNRPPAHSFGADIPVLELRRSGIHYACHHALHITGGSFDADELSETLFCRANEHFSGENFDPLVMQLPEDLFIAVCSDWEVSPPLERDQLDSWIAAYDRAYSQRAEDYEHSGKFSVIMQLFLRGLLK